ncbi:MAG: ECF-type sigma factor [Bryobacteraceae bacterium]
MTRLLHQWQQGDASCFNELSHLIYSELHRIAERYLRSSPSGTLQPTALINEAYLRLVGIQAPLQGRKHFFALANLVRFFHRELRVFRVKAVRPMVAAVQFARS